MSRDALVVGINQYPFLKENSGTAKHLKTPANDAEAIAHLLETYGNFRVRRLPVKLVKGKEQVDPDQSLSVAELEIAIAQLFTPEGLSIPDTALLYFAGHGLRKHLGSRITEGFLATSDANPKRGTYGFSLRLLRELLQASEVKQQIIWLDCCHSGELLNFEEADPGGRGRGRDRCFIAASREFEPAYEDPLGKHGILSGALLSGLDPRQNEGVVTNHVLVRHVQHTLKSALQSPMVYDAGEEIILTQMQVEPQLLTRRFDPHLACPYKGLAYFNEAGDDPQYFYGRTELTEQLVEKVHRSSFLAILGASGSGKSSVIRAGLMYQLQRGQWVSGSDRWPIKVFRPGDQPLRSLALAFLAPDLSDIDRATQFARAESLIEMGAEGLSRLILASRASRVILIVDQFEEVFSLCHDAPMREQFFACLLGTVEQLPERFCLVIAMRADFFGKCAEQVYSGLSRQIQENLIAVTPLTHQELEDVIVKPAQKVGLEVEPELVTQMIADVEGSPGSLPLLQYTLKELWQERHSDRLTLQAYIQLGGIRETLQKRATDVYHSFSPPEQRAIQRIFVELTQLGEGTEDTRRQVRKQDLLQAQSSPDLVDRLIQQLTDEKVRLLVTSELAGRGDSSARVEVVDVAHEALIRHWPLLQSWVNQNRDAIRKQRQIEADTQIWLAEHQSEDYLLRGLKLSEAEGFLAQYRDQAPLPPTAHRFIRKSIQRRDRGRRIRQAITAGAIALSVALLGWTWIDGQTTRSRKLAETSAVLFNFNEFDALIAALRSGHTMRRLAVLQQAPDNLPGVANLQEAQFQTVAALRDAVYEIRSQNRLEGHSQGVNYVQFSPDRQTLISGDREGVIKIWETDGTLRQTLQAHLAPIWSIAFNEDGTRFATTSEDGTIKLWDADGTPWKTLVGHSNQIFRVLFSPEGQTLASASADGTIRFWQPDSDQPHRVIQADQGWVLDIAYSPDGKLLASSGGDGTIKLWNPQGELVKAFNAQHCRDRTCEVWGVGFNRRGDQIASAGDNGTIRIWSLDGTLLSEVGQHADEASELSFSPLDPNGQLDQDVLASVGRDRAIKLWFFLKDKPLNQRDSLTLNGHAEHISNVSFSPDGEKIASASLDRTVRLWSGTRRTLNHVEELWHGSDQGTSLSYSPDGKILVTASSAGNLQLWTRDTARDRWQAEALIPAHPGKVWDVSFSPDGQTFASAGADQTIKIWNRSGALQKTLDQHQGQVFDLSFSRDGTLVSASGDSTVKYWSREGELLETLTDHHSPVLSVSLSPDGQRLASASWDGTIKVWRRRGNRWRLMQDLQGHREDIFSLAFSADGQRLASASGDGTVKVWSRSGDLLQTLHGHTSYVFNVAFSPRGHTLVSAGADKRLILWGADGSQIHQFKGHFDVIRSVQFSPDGRAIASASEDGRTLIWNLDLDDLIAQGCQVLQDYLQTNATVSAADRRLCPGITVDPSLLIAQGRDFARKGEVETAIAQFRAAQDQGATFEFQPREIAQQLSELPAILTAVREAARNPEGQVESLTQKAIALLDQTQTARDTRMSAPEAANQLQAIALMQAAQRTDDLKRTIGLYDLARDRAPEMVLSANDWHFLCRQGSSQLGVADLHILNACDQAIALDPTNGKFRDSQGMARLFLQDDTSGAIASFQAFIDWTNSPQAVGFSTEQLANGRSQRQRCIESLQGLTASPPKANPDCQPFDF